MTAQSREKVEKEHWPGFCTKILGSACGTACHCISVVLEHTQPSAEKFNGAASNSSFKQPSAGETRRTCPDAEAIGRGEPRR